MKVRHVRGAWTNRALLATSIWFALSVAACGGGSSGTSASVSCPVVFGELFPVTGKYPIIGQSYLHGAETAVKDINGHGGILGCSVQSILGDTQFDVADTVTAYRALMLHSPKVILGPTPTEMAAMKSLVDASKIVDIASLPAVQYDTTSDPWLWSFEISDALVAKAMAAYAIQKGYTRCAILFENAFTGSSVADPMIASYKAHGGTIVSDERFVTDQTSYRTEIEKTFTNNPQCVFLQGNTGTTATLLTNARDLGHLNVPFIGTDTYNDINVVTGIGANLASQWLTGVSGAAPTGAASDYFVAAYAAEHYNDVAAQRTRETYDGTVVAALAMTAAKSSDPKVFVNYITQVSNPPGTMVYNYADGVKLLQQGQKINYEGASGPMDFNQNHRVFTGEEIVQVDAAGKQFNIVATIDAATLAGY